ncbi:MAG: hypothetical protein WC878_05450 [Candidatus Paceibacterota bacterium]
MTDPKLAEYISAHLKNGESKEHIRKTLLETGWMSSAVDEALSSPSIRGDVPPPAPVAVVLKNAGDLMGDAYGIFKQRHQTLLGISAVMMAPMFLLTVFSEQSILSSVMNTFGIYLTAFFGIILIILLFIISIWGQIALMYAVKEPALPKEGGHHLGVARAFNLAWHKIGSYWWIAVLTGFLTVGGFLLLIVPGFLFAMWFSMAYFVLVAENEKGMNALLKSREYVKGKVWGVFWRFFVLGFSFLLFFIPVGILFGGLPDPWNGAIVQNVVSFFVTPFSVAYLFLMYRNLVEMRGEFVFAPEKKTKRIFISIGTLGIVLPILFVGFLFWRIIGVKIDKIDFIKTADNVASTSPSAASGDTASAANEAPSAESLPQIFQTRRKGFDAAEQLQIEQIRGALSMYFAENGKYPSELASLTPEYLGAIPTDANTKKPYRYEITPDKKYKLCAEMADRTETCVTP